MSDRKMCSHASEETTVLLIEYCVRCSGWRYSRCQVGRSYTLDGSVGSQVSERHFLELEASDPAELSVLIQRAFRVAQELEQDARNV